MYRWWENLTVRPPESSNFSYIPSIPTALNGFHHGYNVTPQVRNNNLKRIHILLSSVIGYKKAKRKLKKSTIIIVLWKDPKSTCQCQCMYVLGILDSTTYQNNVFLCKKLRAWRVFRCVCVCVCSFVKYIISLYTMKGEVECRITRKKNKESLLFRHALSI